MELIDALNAPTAIVGTVGAGKTFLAKGVVEQLLAAKRRVLIIDPTGVWWGLRSGSDGDASKGFPVTIFGGDHADIEISPDKGAYLAEAIATREVQAIIDVSDMTGGEKTRFLTDFLVTLHARNRAALHLVVDEADEVCPQNPMPEERRLSGAFDKIVRRGRVRGFRPLMITQRPAVLHKNVLSQIGTLIALKLTSPQDRGAIDGWVKGNADVGQAKEVMSSLPTLQRGEGWVWSPAAGILERRSFPPIATFDSSRTPDADDAVVEPALSLVDVEQLRDEMFVAGEQWTDAEKAKLVPRQDPKALADADQRGYQRGLLEGQKHGIALGLAQARSAIDALGVAEPAGNAEISAGVAFVPNAAPKDVVVLPSFAARPERKEEQRARNVLASQQLEQLASGFTVPQTRILRAIAMWKAIGHATPSRQMVALVAGYSASSSGFQNLLGALRTAGAIEYPAGGLLQLLTDTEILPLSEAQAVFFDKLTAPQRKIVTALQPAGELSRDELASATEYSVSSSGFQNLLGAMRSLRILEYPSPGRVALEAWVFDIL